MKIELIFIYMLTSYHLFCFKEMLVVLPLLRPCPREIMLYYFVETSSLF